MYIVGIAQSHDPSVCLLVNGELRVAIALERILRVKRGASPAGVSDDKVAAGSSWHDGIRYCLENEGITFEDIDCFGVVNPDAASDTHQVALARSLLGGVSDSRIGCPPHPGHHLAHALASVYTSPFDECAGLVVDCYGSVLGMKREAETGFILKRGGPQKVAFQNLKTARIGGNPQEDGLWQAPLTIEGIGSCTELFRCCSVFINMERSMTMLARPWV